MKQCRVLMTHELPNKSEPKPELLSVRRGRGVGPGTLWLGVLLFALVMSARAAEPEVAVSVNGRDSAEVFPGMPLLISAVFVSSGATDCSVPPVLLAAGSGPWTNAVTLEIRNAAGALQSWSLRTAITPSNSITLDCAVYARIDWWLTPAETSLLSTDSYTIELVLNTTNAVLPGAWRGVRKALPAQVSLMPEPGSLSEAQAENKYTQLGEY